MSITKERVLELEALCVQFRRELIEILHDKQTGHPGGSLSCTEIMASLYFEVMNLDPSNPQKPDRDRFVLSKGHAAPMLYLALAHRGYFPVEELNTLRDLDSRLQGHPCAHKLPGVELSTGPLGLGLSAALAMSLASKINGYDFNTFVLLGDGEIQEGVIWEAAMSANKFKANRLIAILDHNGVQLDGTNEEIMPMGDIAAKFKAFGWHVLSTDGHDISSVCGVLEEAKAWEDGPVMIISETVKGKGISFMEGKNTWHGAPIGHNDFETAMMELGGKAE